MSQIPTSLGPAEDGRARPRGYLLWHARVLLWCASALAAGCAIAEALAFCGRPLEQPLLYAAAALVAFVGSLVCFVGVAGAVSLEGRRRFGWQFGVVARRASRAAFTCYLVGIAHFAVVACVTVPFGSGGPVIGGAPGRVVFMAGWAMLMSCAAVAVSSAALHPGRDSVGEL